MNACRLSELIQKTYAAEFDVPMWMEGQRLVEVSVEALTADDRVWADPILKLWRNEGSDFKEMGEYPPFIEILMADLCSRNLLEPGDYILEFDD